MKDDIRKLDMLDEREFELINILGSGETANQRILASKMKLSLGMVNMLIRRLATKGMIRIHQLNKQKVQYLLTPKGFAEKMDKSVRYTMKTLDSIGTIRNRLKRVVLNLQNNNFKKFIIYGNDDLIDLLELSFKNHYIGEYFFDRVKTLPLDLESSMLLLCREENDNEIWPENTVFIVKELAKDD